MPSGVPGRDSGLSIIVDRRRYLVAVIALMTAALAWFIPTLSLDPTLKPLFATNSPEGLRYQEYIDKFGRDDFILIAIRTGAGLRANESVSWLRKVTTELRGLDKVGEVVSLADVRVFEKRDGLFGSYPLLVREGSDIKMPNRQAIVGAKRAAPRLNMLLSSDFRTTGIVIRIKPQWSFDPSVAKLLQQVHEIVAAAIPTGSEFRMVGSPVLRQAFLRYNLEIGVRFALLSSLVCMLISLYIFRSLRVAVISMVVAALAVTWALGLMAAAGLQINTATSLSFGLVVVVTICSVTHIVVHFDDQLRLHPDRLQATRRALATVGGPCMMCALTTAAGFATTMVTSIPMIKQLGLIMSLGVILSFIIAIVLTPAILIWAPAKASRTALSNFVVGRVYKGIERLLSKNHLLAAIILTLGMAALLLGAPRITVNTEFISLFSKENKEMQDLRFVETNLSPIQSLELMIESKGRGFKEAKAWKKLAELERDLLNTGHFRSVDSLLPMLSHLHSIFPPTQALGHDLFHNPRFIPQMIAMLKLDDAGKRLIARYLDGTWNTMRVSLVLKAKRSGAISDVIEKAESLAKARMGEVGKVTVTGELALFAAQYKDLVRTQVLSLALAIGVIVILMMIQLRSVMLGFLSLIPNVLPLLAIFGFMGWFGMKLDQVTVFAASISIGLAVDGTVHYLTHLSRALHSGTGEADALSCLLHAHRKAAPAIISSAMILSCGILTLIVSPFRPVASFGILMSVSTIAAMVGDLIYMPAVILTVPWFARMMRERSSGRV